MIQVDKDLLIKDLCSRLPYNVRVKYHLSFAGSSAITTRYTEGILTAEKLGDFILYPKGGLESTRISGITPYLRPISSMMQGEWEQMSGIVYKYGRVNINKEELDLWLNGRIGNEIPMSLLEKVFSWLNEHHFDYRGLIEKGLALPATEDMYKVE